jgi:integrase/recombinase XerD
MERSFRGSTWGPLGEHAEGFFAELAGLGYSRRSRSAHLRLMKDVSEWLGAQGLSTGDLTPEVVAELVAVRREGCSTLRSAKALLPLLSYLRRQGATPMPSAKATVGASEIMAERFARYLSTQRGLAPETVDAYLSQVRPFLVLHAGRDGGGCRGNWSSLTAQQVAGFVTAKAATQRPKSVAAGINALRSLLRWMWLEKMLSAPLADSLGSVAVPTTTAIPKALSPSQITDLVGALPDEGAVRLRNEAMLALMWRLGLRAGEVASLRLEDIDWRVGTLAVRGKGNRLEQVPLPVDVGEVLAAYLQEGRPAGGAYRQVFLAVYAPHRPLAADAVCSVAGRALARAGITGPGAAHRLRHTAACRVLAGGGGLVEAGQLLRHASASATAIYARSDLAALGSLARPWPMQGAGR